MLGTILESHVLDYLFSQYVVHAHMLHQVDILWNCWE